MSEKKDTAAAQPYSQESSNKGFKRIAVGTEPVTIPIKWPGTNPPPNPNPAPQNTKPDKGCTTS